jgi:hypothetical protein
MGYEWRIRVLFGIAVNKDPLSFLQHFGDNFWLQTFDDKKRKDRKDLISDWFMQPNESVPYNMKILNNNGAGIYFCVNELRHMHKKRNADNVETIRAFFCDLDGAPLEPALRCGLQPNIIVSSSTDRWHAYWIMNDRVPADRRMFKELQRAIAKRFSGDESVSDLCRVMRLPGFYNMKKEPFMVTYEVLNEKPYSLKEMQDEFAIRQQSAPVNVPVVDGCSWTNNDTLSLDAGRGGIKNAEEDLEFDASRLRGALLSIDLGSNHPSGIPDEYDTWIKVMLALKSAASEVDAEISEEEAYEYWITWSDLAGGLDMITAEAKWQDTDPRGEVGLGTVFHIATESGWKGKGANSWTYNEWLNKERIRLGIKSKVNAIQN